MFREKTIRLFLKKYGRPTVVDVIDDIRHNPDSWEIRHQEYNESQLNYIEPKSTATPASQKIGRSFGRGANYLSFWLTKRILRINKVTLNTEDVNFSLRFWEVMLYSLIYKEYCNLANKIDMLYNDTENEALKTIKDRKFKREFKNKANAFLEE